LASDSYSIEAIVGICLSHNEHWAHTGYESNLAFAILFDRRQVQSSERGDCFCDGHGVNVVVEKME
jgi:hypothetical protein